MSGPEIALIAISVVGTGVSMYSQIQAGNAAAKAAKRTQEIMNDEANAAIAANEAENRLRRKQHQKQTGELEVGAGSSGASGFEDIFIDDIYTLESNLLLSTYNAKVYAHSRRAQGQVARYEGDALKASATTGAIGTGLTAVGTIGLQGYQASNAAKTTTTTTKLGGSTSSGTTYNANYGVPADSAYRGGY